MRKTIAIAALLFAGCVHVDRDQDQARFDDLAQRVTRLEQTKADTPPLVEAFKQRDAAIAELRGMMSKPPAK